VREGAAQAIRRALCVDHGHSKQDGGDRCRTCQRRADAVLDALAAAGYRLAGPGEVVVRLPEPDGAGIPEAMHGLPDAELLPYWLIGDERLYPGDPDGVLYAVDEYDHVPELMRRTALVMLAAGLAAIQAEHHYTDGSRSECEPDCPACAELEPNRCPDGGRCDRACDLQCARLIAEECQTGAEERTAGEA